MAELPYRSIRDFVIQWHITDRCNWNCLHCYREEEKKKDLPLSILMGFLRQFVDFAEILKLNRLILNIGGGEPFIRDDFFKLLKSIDKYKIISLGIMSNGSFIDKKVAKFLSKLKTLRSIQLSLEGMEEVNDKIRGKGAFNKTVRAIEILTSFNIHVRISMTATSLNFKDMAPLARFLREKGVETLGIRRYVPLGEGKQIEKYMFSPHQTKKYYLERENIRKELSQRGKFYLSYGCEDGIMALLYPEKEIPIRHCAVMDKRGGVVDTNGHFLICRRMPIKIGNLLKKTFTRIYFTSRTYDRIASIKNQPLECRNCPYFEKCLAGAKCIAYAVTGNPLSKDPQCWRVDKDFSRGL